MEPTAAGAAFVTAAASRRGGHRSSPGAHCATATPPLSPGQLSVPAAAAVQLAGINRFCLFVFLFVCLCVCVCVLCACVCVCLCVRALAPDSS